MNAKSWQARGLIGWYAMQGEGSKLWDLSPRGNHGDLQAQASIEWSGQLGQPVLRAKINSGASNNGVRIPNIYGSASSEGTLLLYIRNFGNSNGAPIDYTSDFNVHHYPFGGSDNGNDCYCNALHGSRINVIDWLPNKDAWHWYVVKTKNGTNNWQWWQDGRKIAQQNGQSNIPDVTSETRRVLASNSNSGQGWGGFMAEARFYDYWWPDEQIIHLARRPLERYELYQSIVGRAWFIPDQGQSIQPPTLSIATSIPTPQLNQTVIAGPFNLAPNIPAPMIFETTLIQAPILNLAPTIPAPLMVSRINPAILNLPVSVFTPIVFDNLTPISPLAIDKRTLKAETVDKRTLKVN